MSTRLIQDKAHTSESATDSQAAIVLRAVPSLERWLEATLSANGETDLSVRQLAVLQQIADGATTPGQIAKALHVTPAVITGLVDRMERRGYVQRLESQADRRMVLLELTVSGEDARMLANEALTREIRGKLAKLSANERQNVASSIQLLNQTATRH